MLPMAAGEPAERFCRSSAKLPRLSLATSRDDSLSGDVESLLAHIKLLDGLALEELVRLAPAARLIRVPRGDIVVHKGDECTGLHVVMDGKMKLALTSRHGSERVAAILGPGQSFDLASLLLNKPYVTSAQTLTDALLLHISKDAILEELQHNQGLCLRLLTGMAMREHEFMDGIESCSHYSARQRFIGYLVHGLPQEIQNERNISVTLPSSKGTIASLLNFTPETFSRILRDLTLEGLIVVNGRRIQIPCAGELRSQVG